MADSVSSRKTVFACFAHPDDEVGALGTLANHGDCGDRVVLAWMTCGENTSMSKAKIPSHRPPVGSCPKAHGHGALQLQSSVL